MMEANALRTWGIAASALCMAGALALSLTTPAPQASAQPAEASAQAPAGPAAAAFLVRFRGQGPIARAQAQAAHGQEAQARRIVEAQLLRQTAFNGLCFDRFTVGGAEIVLRTCQTFAPEARAAAQQSWLRRLRAMRAVEYADANVTATQERAPS